MRKTEQRNRRVRPHSQLAQLRAIVDRCIAETKETGGKAKPEWIANAAMNRLDRKSRSPVLVAFASNLELRQIARDRLRNNFEPRTADEVEEAPTHPLFPDMHAMYPLKRRAKEEEASYVPPEHEEFTEEDMLWNYRRDRTAGGSLIRSADALYAWWYSELNPKNRKRAAGE
jgi:hypothetical protein